MNPGYKHFSTHGFGDSVWHKTTKDKGIVIGISLRPNCAPSYNVVFEDSRNEMLCLEFELTDEQPSPVESK